MNAARTVLSENKTVVNCRLEVAILYDYLDNKTYHGFVDPLVLHDFPCFFSLSVIISDP